MTDIKRYEVWAPALFGWTKIGFHITLADAQEQARKLPGARIHDRDTEPSPNSDMSDYGH
jgi:hypothetical protein